MSTAYVGSKRQGLKIKVVKVSAVVWIEFLSRSAGDACKNSSASRMKDERDQASVAPQDLPPIVFPWFD